MKTLKFNKHTKTRRTQSFSSVLKLQPPNRHVAEALPDNIWLLKRLYHLLFY